MSSSDFDSCTAYEIRQFNFNNLPEISELKNFQLKAFRTPDGWKKVSTWRGIYHVFCLYVFEIKPQHIKALRDLDGTFLSRNIIFSNTPNDLNDAFQIKGNLYAEQCLNSTRIVHIIAKLIEFCRLPAKQFIVRYEVPTTEKAVPTPESKPKVTSLPSTSYFTLADTIPSVKGTKPVSIKIGRNETPISSWRKIVVQVVDYIAQKKPESLKVLFKAFGPQNPNATLISRDAQSLRDPLQVRPRVWIEGNVNSERAINIALLFLEYSNIKPSKVQIEYIPTPGTLVSSETITDEVEPVPESPEPKDDDEIIAEDNDNNMPELTPKLQTLLKTIEEQFPRGIDLNNPSHLSILEHHSGIRCTDKIRDDLIGSLFESNNGIAYLPSQITNEPTLNEISAFIDQQISQYGALALSNVRDRFRYQLHFLTEDLVDFSKFIDAFINPKLEQKVETYYYEDDNIFYCLPKSTSEKQFDTNISLQLKQYLQERCDAVSINELCEKFSYLDKDILEFYLEEDGYIDDVFPVYNEDENVYYYRTINSLYLEDDFPKTLTDAVEEIESRGEVATIKSITAKLDEHYHNLLTGNEFREAYGLIDDDAFRYVVQQRYDGEVSHKWGTKTRFVPETSKGQIKLYEEFKKQYPNCGVFHENLFFEFAKKKTGSRNASSLILIHLRPHYIRLDIDHWIDIQEFQNQSNFNPELAHSITAQLMQQLGSRPFLSLGLLSDTFFEELPELRLNGTSLQWNEYLLTSVSALLIDDLTIVNDDPNAYQVTALLIPSDKPVPNDLIEYVLKYYSQQNGSTVSVEGAVEFLKQYRIRMKRTDQLVQQLEVLLREP